MTICIRMHFLCGGPREETQRHPCTREERGCRKTVNEIHFIIRTINSFNVGLCALQLCILLQSIEPCTFPSPHPPILVLHQQQRWKCFKQLACWKLLVIRLFIAISFCINNFSVRVLGAFLFCLPEGAEDDLQSEASAHGPLRQESGSEGASLLVQPQVLGTTTGETQESPHLCTQGVSVLAIGH